jgi:hypothetical protein
MARVTVLVVHDESGRIVAVARPAVGAKTVVLSGAGQSVLETEADEDSVMELVSGVHRVDLEQKKVVLPAT